MSSHLTDVWEDGNYYLYSFHFWIVLWQWMLHPPFSLGIYLNRFFCVLWIWMWKKVNASWQNQAFKDSQDNHKSCSKENIEEIICTYFIKLPFPLQPHGIPLPQHQSYYNAWIISSTSFCHPILSDPSGCTVTQIESEKGRKSERNGKFKL